jgi:hypothetical protein
MKNDNLERRAVAALRNDGVSLTELTDLIREGEGALTAADVTAEETRREAIDPVLSPDPALARERVNAAEFACDRLSALLSRLEARHQQIAATERIARWEADYECVKAERDQLATELAETCPQVVAKLVDLLNRMACCERECERIASTAPSGERRRLLGPELHAKGLSHFTRDTPSFTRDLRLPEWEQPAATAWPPQRTREVLTFPLYAHRDRYSGNWWRAR